MSLPIPLSLLGVSGDTCCKQEYCKTSLSCVLSTLSLGFAQIVSSNDNALHHQVAENIAYNLPIPQHFSELTSVLVQTSLDGEKWHNTEVRIAGQQT